MPHQFRFSIGLLSILSATTLASAAETLIDLSDIDAVRARRPLLIAHRGGAISEGAPECSLAAIRAADAADYDMVELDVRESKDGVPMIFHDANLKEDCGLDGGVEKFTADELRGTLYNGTNERIADLDTTLCLCRELNLGVMLDVKQAGEACLTRAAELVRKHGLEHSTVTINGDPTVQRCLKEVSLLRITEENQAKLADLPPDTLRDRFWFGLPQNLPSDLVPLLQSKGALVIPAINTFRYRENPDPQAPQKDIERLEAAGVDGFQIDSAYQSAFSE